MTFVSQDRAVFDDGLAERILHGRMSLSDCALLYEALRPFGVDAYSDEVDASWPVTVVSEFKNAVEAARGTATGWHVFGPGHKTLPSANGTLKQSDRAGSAGAFSTGLDVMKGEFTHCSLLQSSALPGARNTLTLAISSNVTIAPGRIDGENAIPTKLILSGLSALRCLPVLEQSKTVVLGGSAAQEISATDSASQDSGFGLWDEARDALVLHVVGVLDADVTHTISFTTLNPSDGRPALAHGDLSLESRGAVDIGAAAVHVEPLEDGAETEEARMGRGLAVVPPRFLVARFKQGSLFPGAENRISVTLAASCALHGGQRQRVVISGLLGSRTPDSDHLPIQEEGGSGAEGVFGTTAVWRRLGGVLELAVVGEAEAGREYSLSFALCNPSAPLPAEDRGEGVFIAAAGVVVNGRRMDPEIAHVTRQPSHVGGQVVESEAEVAPESRDWYDTFAGHLRRQYPDLYSGGLEGGTRGEGPGTVMVGVTGEFELSAVREMGGDLRVRWHRTAPARLSTHSSVFILQLAPAPAPAGVSAAAASFRTVFAGLACECVVAAALAPASTALLLRVREEARDAAQRSQLLSSTWSAPLRLHPASRPGAAPSASPRPFTFDRSALVWDAATAGEGVRLSGHRHSMRRDNRPSWGGVLAVAGVGRGSTGAFRFAFMGRTERVMVGLALRGQACDGRPAARWDDDSCQAPRSVRKLPVPGDAGAGGGGDSLSVVWVSDGSFIAFGRAREAAGGAERAMCIEGDTIGVRVDNAQGWVEFTKGSAVLLRQELQLGEAAGQGMLFPFACSGGGCTVSLLPYD